MQSFLEISPMQYDSYHVMQEIGKVNQKMKIIPNVKENHDL